MGLGNHIMFLHRFTMAVAAASFLLVVAGSLVASTGSGLAIPDWPNSYGWPMFALPFSNWVGGVWYQQGHRLAGMLVGLLTVVLALVYIRSEARTWVKALTLVAVGAVIAQGLLGGLAVLRGLPVAVSTTHAGLAQIFFALVVALGVVTSPGWARAYDDGGYRRDSTEALTRDGLLRGLAVAAIVLVYAQVMLGAGIRHTGAAQAIPDYPLAFGRLVPTLDSLSLATVALSFVHRVWALLVAGVVAATAWRILARHRERSELVKPALLMAALVTVEVVLGATAVLVAGSVWVTSSLVAVGALLLATTVALALRVHRPFFADTPMLAHGGAGYRGHAAGC